MLQRRLLTLLRRSRARNGFTLVEVLVTVAIIGIMSTVTISLIAAVFDSNIRSGQMLAQQGTIETAYGFMAQRLAVAQTVGSQTDTTHLDPLTIAGDQLVFSPQNGTCVRMFYQESNQYLRVKVSGACTNDDLKPVRGPNQAPIRGGVKAQPGDADFDPAVDLDPGKTCADMGYAVGATCKSTWRGAVTIAVGITPNRPASASTATWDAILQMYKYRDQYSQLIDAQSTHPDVYACNQTLSFGACNRSQAKATSGTNNTWYTAADVNNKPWNNVSSVDVTTYISPTTSTGGQISGSAQAPVRLYSQNYSLRQVCPGTGTGGSTLVPGTVTASGVMVGTGASNATIATAAGATDTVKTVAAGTDFTSTNNVVDGAIPAYLDFAGQIQVKNASASQSNLVKVHVQFLANSVVQDEYIVPAVIASNTVLQSIPVASGFNVTGSNPGTFYQLRVRLENTSANGVVYSTEGNNLRMRWSAIAH